MAPFMVRLPFFPAESPSWSQRLANLTHSRWLSSLLSNLLRKWNMLISGHVAHINRDRSGGWGFRGRIVVSKPQLHLRGGSPLYEKLKQPIQSLSR